MLGEVIIDNKRIFALFHEFLADSTAGIWRWYCIGAGSAAFATTTTVVSARRFFQYFNDLATFAAFCPIAT
jgi:hypothetical protein